MPITVLVTGITGYLGSHVANQLLSCGYRVRGTLRSLKKSDEVYSKVVPATVDPANLEIHEIDLLDSQDKWEALIRGCTFVQHIASPFSFTVPKDENELIKPAVEGTLNILKAAQAVGGVQRVIITSSTVAIVQGRESEYEVYDTCSLKLVTEGHLFTESDWSDLPKLTPYFKSKTLAEQAAWNFVQENNHPFELATINPGFIQGPYLLPYFGSSAEIITGLMTNQYPAVPHPLFFSTVDVRDLALIHIRAMERKEANGHRFISAAVSQTLTILGYSEVLREEFLSQGYTPPKRSLPNVVTHMLSWIDKNMKSVVAIIGKNPRLDISLAENILEIEWTPIKNTLVDTAYSLIELGHIPKKQGYKSKGTNVI